jgi:flagellar biogenesis protein FliO
MRRRVMLTIAAVGLAWSYWVAVIAAIGFAASLYVPTMFWLGIVPTHRPAPASWRLQYLATELMLDSVAIFLVTIPFAWVLGRIFKRRGPLLGAAIAVVIVATTYGPFRNEIFESTNPTRMANFLADAAEILAFLPLLAWILQRMPSNYRLERP